MPKGGTERENSIHLLHISDGLLDVPL